MVNSRHRHLAGILYRKIGAAHAQQAGLFLKEPRYPFFPAAWIVVLFLISYILAWLYASARVTRGAGPKTALTIGLFVGFAAGFPSNLAQATWSPVDRIFPLWWMLEMGVGAILAAFTAGWPYRDLPIPRTQGLRRSAP
jgi:hypothetical protein